MNKESSNSPDTSPNLPPALLAALDSHDPALRGRALFDAAALINSGQITAFPPGPRVSLRARTFDSRGTCSPSRLAWEARRQGLTVVGSCDTDGLDAMNELHDAGDILAIRTTTSIETRVFADSGPNMKASIPGAPGIQEVMAAGVTRTPGEAEPAGRRLCFLKEQSRRRHKALVERINAVLSPVTVNFEKDVLPLSPYGNASESHICAAFTAKARKAFADSEPLAEFWARVLKCRFIAAHRLLSNEEKLRSAFRNRFLDGDEAVHYDATRATLPHMTCFFDDAASFGGIPCLSWRGGSSSREADPERLLESALTWGIMGVGVKLNPEWQWTDEGSNVFLARLKGLAQAARARSLPVLAGSDILDDGGFGHWMHSPSLEEFRDDFIFGGYWLYGHTFLGRRADMGLVGDWARNAFAGDRAAAAEFYAEAGRLAAPGADLAVRAAPIRRHMRPKDILAALRG